MNTRTYVVLDPYEALSDSIYDLNSWSKVKNWKTRRQRSKQKSLITELYINIKVTILCALPQVMFALITQLYSLHTKGRILGCVPLGGSGFGFVIQDHIDLGTLEEWSFRVRSFGSMHVGY